MAISTRILGTAKGDKSGTSFPVPITATTAGEYVEVLSSYSYDAGYVAAVTGYTAISDNTGLRTSFMPYHQVFAKTAGAGETALTITKGSGVANFAVLVLGHTGVDPTSPYAAAPVFSSRSAGRPCRRCRKRFNMRIPWSAGPSTQSVPTW